MTIHETDTDIRRAYDGTDWRAAVGYRPICVVVRTTTQSVNNNTMTDVSWSSSIRNEYGMWSAGSPTLVTIPAGADGLYMVVHSIQWASQAVAAGQRLARLDVGGVEQMYVTVPATSNLNATAICSQLTHPMIMTGGEQITGRGFQTSGGALNIASARMTVYMISET
jgi:hypothetical protein